MEQERLGHLLTWIVQARNLRWWIAEKVDPAGSPPLLWLSMAAAAVLIGLASVALWDATGREQRQLAERTRALPLKTAEPSSGHNVSAVPDFVARLPQLVRSERLAHTVERSASAAGATVIAMSIQSSPATEDRLARADLSAELRGTYAAIKDTLAGIVARLHPATVTRLHVRTLEDGMAEVHGTLTVTVWGAPTAAQTIAPR